MLEAEASNVNFIARTIERATEIEDQCEDGDVAKDIPITVAVDYGSATSSGCPAGAPWMVRPRRDDKAVIVPSAKAAPPTVQPNR